jgi:hypothetical protein
MPLFMDVHEAMPEGATFDDVAGAHSADVAIQGNYGVTYRQFWVDEDQRKVFCLAEAPDSASAERVHREAHGLVATRIYAVREGV